MTSQYSDLEAVRDSDQPGLEHHQMHQLLPAKYNDAQVAPQYTKDYYGNQQYEVPAKPPPQRLWGLKPRTFWIVFTLVSIIIVGAAVGGGVGAATSHKSTSTASTSNSDINSNSTTPTPTTSKSSPSLTTTPVAGPSSTLLRDCPSSNGSFLTISPSSSNPMTFIKLCGTTFTNSNSDPSTQNVVRTVTTTLDDCIGLCGAYNEANKSGVNDGSENVCNAVCWRNGFTNDDFPGTCFGFMTSNGTAGQWSTESVGECDGAGWVDERKLV
jgi:hypothetical protein